LPRAGSPASPFREVGAAARELLDPIVAPVHDVHVAREIHRDPTWVVELAGGDAVAAPLRQVGAAAVELLHAMVVLIDHIDVAEFVGGDCDRVVELSRIAPLTAPLEHPR